MACNCAKNQTDEKHLKGIKDFTKAMGTGLFLVPAPEIGIMENRVVLVEGLSYSECVKRGAGCQAFKWVPNSKMKYKELVEKRKECKGIGCPGNNASTWCPWCICGGDMCY